MLLVTGRELSAVATLIVLPEKEATGELQALPFANNRVYVIVSFGSVVSPRLFVKGGKV
jgi:hypothetical protein